VIELLVENVNLELKGTLKTHKITLTVLSYRLLLKYSFIYVYIFAYKTYILVLYSWKSIMYLYHRLIYGYEEFHI
jgi:hypothetical protein